MRNRGRGFQSLFDGINSVNSNDGIDPQATVPRLLQRRGLTKVNILLVEVVLYAPEKGFQCNECVFEGFATLLNGIVDYGFKSLGAVNAAFKTG